jgi:exopolysaccharide biosynthesis protein
MRKMYLTNEILVFFIIADVALIGILVLAFVAYFKNIKKDRKKLTDKELKMYHYSNKTTTWKL